MTGLRYALPLLAMLVGLAPPAGTPAWAAAYRLVYSFGGSASDGTNPEAALLNVNGVLYGTTVNGGATNNGTVFQINPATGVEAVVHSFKGGTDGALPYAPLINVGGRLYGTTWFGGASNIGTVFRLNPATGAVAVMHSFKGSPNDGDRPSAGLLNVGGTLWGTTFYGGSGGCDVNVGCGSVFKLVPSSGAFTLLHSFTPVLTCCGSAFADGAYPRGGLTALGGKLYGTTYLLGGDGSPGHLGTAYVLDPATGSETVLHDFLDSNAGGVRPVDNLITVNGLLYGVAVGGGAVGAGTVFRLDPATGITTVLYAFRGGTDGSAPDAALLNVGGTLYGTTALGGSTACPNGCGTVFSLSLRTGIKRTVYSFAGGRDGNSPAAALINVGGTLYGTTQYGGAYDKGTVFAITP